ncbi:MAG: SH3 domain-containing protein [Anaerolineae bacterium]|nr:SH3 domain-containing protein [Anaerolineae bacterium]
MRLESRHCLWITLVLLAIVLAALLGPGPSAWARPGQRQYLQTVPTPTPTGAASPLPTATPYRPTRVPTNTPPPARPTNTPVSTPTPIPKPVAIPSADMNVRAGPSTDAAVEGTAYAGRTYVITGRNPAGDWWRIDYEGLAGWLYAPLVQVQGDTTQVPIVGSAMPPTVAPTDTPMPTATPVQLPELAVLVTADPPWGIPGRVVTFRVQVSNVSAVDATDVAVRDDLPALLIPGAVHGQENQVTIEGQVVSAHLGLLPAGGTATILIDGVIRPDAPLGKVIDNIVEALCAEGVRASAGTSVPLPPKYLPPTGVRLSR